MVRSCLGVDGSNDEQKVIWWCLCKVSFILEWFFCLCSKKIGQTGAAKYSREKQHMRVKITDVHVDTHIGHQKRACAWQVETRCVVMWPNSLDNFSLDSQKTGREQLRLLSDRTRVIGLVRLFQENHSCPTAINFLKSVAPKFLKIPGYQVNMHCMFLEWESS